MLFNNINRAMLKAARRGDAGKLKQLLAAGADVSYGVVSGASALILAAENRHTECIKVLLEYAPDLEQKGNFGAGIMTALTWAAYKGNLAMVKMLVEAGANLDHIDKFGRTPLMAGATSGAGPEIVAYLLEKGALTHLRDNEGQDAEGLALKFSNPKAAALLRKPSGPKADGEWRFLNETAVRRTVPFGDGMTLTEHFDFAEKTYTTILHDAEGKFSHTRQPFNHVAKPLIQQASAARRELGPPPGSKALPKPERNEMRSS